MPGLPAPPPENDLTGRASRMRCPPGPCPGGRIASERAPDAPLDQRLPAAPRRDPELPQLARHPAARGRPGRVRAVLGVAHRLARGVRRCRTVRGGPAPDVADAAHTGRPAPCEA